MAYGVTNDGFVRKPFSVIRAEVEDYQRAHANASLLLTDRSTQGQMNVSYINQSAELWELAEAVYNAHYPDSSNGWNLDQVCALTGTRRNVSTKTTVPANVTLNPFKNLPVGSVANLISQPNKRFVTLTEVPADPAGGVFSVDFIAEEAGATQVAVGQLSEIAEPVDGWTAVTNPVVGDTGAEREEDDELRLQREYELQAQGSTNVDSIRADLLRVEGVVDAVVIENDTDVQVGLMTAHSIRCILRGGASADIAQALFTSKGAGIDTIGSVTVAVLDSQGYSHDINFDFATEKVVHAAVTVLTDPLVFDAVQGPIDIAANMAAYTNSLGVGDDAIYDQYKCAALDVAGVIDTPVTKISYVDPPTGTVNLVVAVDEYASGDVANMDVTVT